MDSQKVNLQLLAARVANLEASNRRWKAATIVVALFASSLFMMAAKPADRIEPPVLRAATVEAQEFILKGEDGHVYARLTLNSGMRELVGKVLVPAGTPGRRHRFSRTRCTASVGTADQRSSSTTSEAR